MHQYPLRYLKLLAVFSVLQLGCALLLAVEKPTGLFASSGAMRDDIFENPNLRGVLVRTHWALIEPTPGTFNFSDIDRQVRAIESKGKDWSLAVIGGGTGSPDWLMNQEEAPYFEYSFRGKSGYRLPLFWDLIVQRRLATLAEALGEKYAGASHLKLVYVTQMTANGIEGHLNGFDMGAFAKAGYTDERWATALTATARAFAAAFPQKAIAVEVHEINRSADVPMQVLNALWSDPSLNQRVGAAVWWLSGRDNYQPALIEALTRYPGDIYAQVIGNSSQPQRFAPAGYAELFAQARTMGIRYIEPWEYEFGSTTRSAHGALDKDMAAFNQWADATYTEKAR